MFTHQTLSDTRDLIRLPAANDEEYLPGTPPFRQPLPPCRTLHLPADCRMRKGRCICKYGVCSRTPFWIR